MKGTVTLLPGVDLTESLWPLSDDEMDAKYGPDSEMGKQLADYAEREVQRILTPTTKN